jgi:hypothetical protein
MFQKDFLAPAAATLPAQWILIQSTWPTQYPFDLSSFSYLQQCHEEKFFSPWK